MNNFSGQIVTAAGSTLTIDDELDTAILTALAGLGSALIPWARLREQLPRAPYWATVRALVRLHDSGKLSAFKVRGRTYVDPVSVVRR